MTTYNLGNEILNYIEHGKSIQEISELLGVSTHTVKAYIAKFIKEGKIKYETR